MNPRELITIVRQIGGMMEAGVDILRITRVLRAQSGNPRLLELCDSIDRELTMGRGLADALSRAPDLFSPFAVSLIRQGEERNNLAAAFLRVADFLQQDQENTAPEASSDEKQTGARPNPVQSSAARVEIGAGDAASSRAPRDDSMVSDELQRAQSTLQVPIAFDGASWRVMLEATASLLGALAAVSALCESPSVGRRWRPSLSLGAGAVVCAAWSRLAGERISLLQNRESKSGQIAFDVPDSGRGSLSHAAPVAVNAAAAARRGAGGAAWPDENAAWPDQDEANASSPGISRLESTSGSASASLLAGKTTRDEEDFD